MFNGVDAPPIGGKKRLDVDPQRDDDASLWTDIDEAKVISALCQKSKFEFRTFLKKKIKFLGFHGEVFVKTFPLMHQLLM